MYLWCYSLIDKVCPISKKNCRYSLRNVESGIVNISKPGTESLRSLLGILF